MTASGGQQSFPPVKEYYKHRFKNGANLSGVYVLDRSLFPGMFHSAANGSSELDAVKAAIAFYGVSATRKKWQSHWSQVLSDPDIRFLATVARINTIRLPIGYYTLGPRFCRATPFQGKPAKVYKNAWRCIGKLCRRLHKWGIAVILAFYALPGGANASTSSGTSSGRADLWSDAYYLELSKSCFQYVAKHTRGRFLSDRYANIIGLQLCNEPVRDAPGLYSFYAQAAARIQEIDKGLPLYISDAGDIGKAIEWAAKQNKLDSKKNPIVVETHRNYRFYGLKNPPTVDEIMRQIPFELLQTSDEPSEGISKGKIPVFVGEWSSALDPNILKDATADSKDNIIAELVDLQRRQWQSRATGHAFWPLKIEHGDGRAIFHPAFLRYLRAPEIIPESVECMKGTYNLAIAQGEFCWRRAILEYKKLMKRADDPCLGLDRRQFERGWHRGWSNGLEFYTMSAQPWLPRPQVGGDWIANVDAWLLYQKTRDKRVWNAKEFDRGFRIGLADVEEALGFPKRV